jgi:transposase-like protein
MIIQVLYCPHCQGTDDVRHGKIRQGKQRYRCQEKRCAGHTFLLDYPYLGHAPEVKRQIIDMALNASGMRDTAGVLHVSTNTVMKERKQRNLTSSR